MNVTITPYDKNIMKPETIAWLKEDNINIPLDAPFGRYPSPKEVRQVLSTFTDCTTEYKITSTQWMAETLCGENRISIIVEFSGDENDQFGYLSFSGNYEDVLQVIKRLSQICGTFIVLLDGESPTLILPDKA